jgi:hypothetical protein
VTTPLIPPDTPAAGQTGHVQAHAQISDALSWLVAAVQAGDLSLPQLDARYLRLAGGAMSGAASPAVVPLADAPVIAVSALLGNDFRVTLGGNRVMGLPVGPSDGQWASFELGQPLSGGPWTAVFPGPLAVPPAPAPSFAPSGGTVAAGTYRLAVTTVNATGETAASVSAPVTTTGAASVITVPPPPAAYSAAGWYAYSTQAGGSSYTRQQPPGSPSLPGVPLILAAPPTWTGAAAPSVNTTGAGGYSFGTQGHPVLSATPGVADQLVFRYSAARGRWLFLFASPGC